MRKARDTEVFMPPARPLPSIPYFTYCHFPSLSIFKASSIAALSSRSNPFSSSSGVFLTKTSGATQ